MPVASDKGGGSFQLAPVGNHLAICVQVIDLGTQKDAYLGKPKNIRKVRLSFELPEETAIFDEARGEEPFMVSKEYTLSLSEKAHLRHDIEAWRGVPFSKEELAGFELKRLLGAPCMVNVVHETSKNNRVYAKITSITRLPKKIKKADVPKPVNELLCYDIDDNVNEVFQKLPEFIRDKIKASLEATGEIGSREEPASSEDDSIPF